MEGSLKVVLLDSFYSPSISTNGLSEIPNVVPSTVPRNNSNHTDNFHNFSFIPILNYTETSKRTREMTKSILEVLYKSFTNTRAKDIMYIEG